MLSVGREAKTVHYHISKEGNSNTECNCCESRFNQTSSRRWSMIGIPLFDVYVDILKLHDEDDEAGKRRVFA